MNHAWTASQDSQLREMAEGGMTRMVIARHLDLSLRQIKRRGKRLGILFKGKHPRKVDWRRAKELAEGSVWMSEASRIMGTHPTTLLYIGRQMGFKWPAPPVKRPKLAPGWRKPVIWRDKPEDLAKVERMMCLAERLRGAGRMAA